MSRTVSLGGDRIGSGNKMKVNLEGFSRSTHDLSYLWRSTMSPGTLVPFLSKVMLPGDTFDIDLNTSALTHPTIGPLYGSYKLQLDVYTIPVRLYNGKLHNNALNVGLSMKDVKLPQIEITGSDPDFNKDYDIDNCQINPSCLLSYLNIRGVGLTNGLHPNKDVTRSFNAIPLLAYWDIYKNYYANKQENILAVIHSIPKLIDKGVTEIKNENITIPLGEGNLSNVLRADTRYHLIVTAGMEINPSQILLHTNTGIYINLEEAFEQITRTTPTIINCSGVKKVGFIVNYWGYQQENTPVAVKPEIRTLALDYIDDMRDNLLLHTRSNSPYVIKKGEAGQLPYNLMLDSASRGTERAYSKLYSQEGLAIKTYQSDLFNNWLNRQIIMGEDGVNSISSIDVTDGNFTVEQFILAKKVFDLLNRVAVSGGSYDDWIGAVYDHEPQRKISSPVYVGGLSKEIVFEEVISNSDSGDQPLGTLAGRGVQSGKHKGGKIVTSVDEISYIMGIVSITPRLDYSQGNEWDTSLKTMDDFHKPNLDQIGFQELMAEQLAWWSVRRDEEGNINEYSVGLQPSWINYQTSVNQTRGNFAIARNEMFMTLNRRYEPLNVLGGISIKDATSYIDPSKFNHIFAATEIDAQNFWIQISIDIEARRKMSAKVMPNL